MGNSLTYVSQLQPIKVIKQLERIGRNVVSAPPGMLEILAKEKIDGALKISPKLIYSYAEILYPDVKKFLEKMFKCNMYQTYQRSKGSYVTTCKEGNLHINEGMVFLELCDKDGKPTKKGEPWL